VNWALVEENAHVIGDFTWTGYDYLGEVGIGRPHFLAEGEEPSHSAPYPWIAAWCGDLDLIGTRRPASYYREIVFGLRTEPWIAVVRPGNEDKALYAGPWTWSDSIGSWNWEGHEGEILSVEVYSDADAVELALDGQVVATGRAGREHRYRAVFDVPYRPGTLTATAIRDGVRAETSTIASRRGESALTARVDAAGPDGVAMVEIAVIDGERDVVMNADCDVEVRVDGPAELIALGSADPAPETTYSGASTATFDGRALAVIRRIGEGAVRVVVQARGLPEVAIDLP